MTINLVVFGGSAVDYIFYFKAVPASIQLVEVGLLCNPAGSQFPDLLGILFDGSVATELSSPKAVVD